MGTESRMKSLLSVSLVLLSSFAFTTTSELFSERNDECTESSQFLIKNFSPNTKKPYLTLDVKTGSLSGGKLSKKGKPRRNQIWSWLNCGDGDFLSNQAEGKLLSIKGKNLNVVDSVSTSSAAAWIYDSELGTLRDVQSKKYVRLIKKKARVALAKKLRLMKKGPEKGKPWGWFRWSLEFLDSGSTGSGSSSRTGSGSSTGSGFFSNTGSGSGFGSSSGPGSGSGSGFTSGSGSESGSSSGFGSGFTSGSGSVPEPGCVDCQTMNGTACQFPFFINGKEYNTCTMDYTAPGETPWCATRVDGAGNFLHLQSAAWGYCESNCPTDTDSSATLACPHSEPAFPEECKARHNSTHKNIIFLGNSYTDGAGCIALDFLVRKIAEGAGFSATTERSSPGGRTLEWHATNSLDRIKNGDWDAVVLQDQSQRPSFGAQYVYNYIIPNVLTLTKTMRDTNVCTLPVFFQTWGKRDGDTMNCSPAPYDALCTFDGVQDQLTQAYHTMAYVSQPAKVAPAGEAWRTYANRNSLFANDGSHATCSGTFLAACTIFQQIWGVPSSSSTYSYHTTPDAAALKEQADAIVAAGSGSAAGPEPWSWPSTGPPCPACIG